jgi:hypothetical protein
VPINGQGMLLSATDTGTRANGNPVFDIRLTVAAAGAAAYEASVASEVGPQAARRCVPGTTVPVRIDPDDPARLWIDWSADAGSGGT